LQGLAGDIVKAIDPHTEADPAAILVQILVGFGNLVGPAPFFQIEANPHRANLFAILVGQTSKSRKGTSWAHVKGLLKRADQEWAENCHVTGLSSGEGVIWAVRDPTDNPTAAKPSEDSQAPGAVHPPADKRLLVHESEFSRVLRVQSREGNTLSALLRQAWDDGDLQILTKNTPVRATGAHISIVGHITQDELRRELTFTDQANGFANRFLFVCVRRSKLRPRGGQVDSRVLQELAGRLRQAAEFARNVQRVVSSEKAWALWDRAYCNQLSAEPPGLVGAITARGDTQVRRLSLVYALLDRSRVIRMQHLRAALEVWRYCEDSCRYIFGNALGNPVADRILDALRKAPHGLTRTEISELFARNVSEAATSAALEFLRKQGRAFMKSEKSGERGRPTERWFTRRPGGRVGR
jgi:hypothetical protein